MRLLDTLEIVGIAVSRQVQNPPMAAMRRGVILSVVCLISTAGVNAFSTSFSLVRKQAVKLQPQKSLISPKTTSVAPNPSDASPGTLLFSSASEGQKDELILRTSDALRRTSWISWWAQIILTTVSSVILLFARNIGRASPRGTVSASGGFVFAGTGEP